MGTMSGNRTGLAGELRVMSELLLHGHNPAKSYLEEGPDILIENGYRIEVKASRLRLKQKKAPIRYGFNFMGGNRRRKQDLTTCDFLILWCIDHDCFYIIPMNTVRSTSPNKHICISNMNAGKYHQYKDNWGQLDKEKG